MIDEAKIEEAVRLFLEGIGEDKNREGLRETPGRISRMCHELFGGIGQDGSGHLSKVFSVEDGGMVVEKDIPFYSVCEHHLLPFFGKAHIAYVPDGKVTGLSKLARTVEVYARRAQIQERMTIQIAEDIMAHLKPRGVMVMVEAEHMCMAMRGIKKPGTRTASFAAKGIFETDQGLRDTFFQMVR